MQRIFPVTEEACRPHCGKPVVVYLQDGTEIHGMLSRVENGQLILNDDAVAAASSKKGKSAKASHRKATASDQAQINAFDPLGYPPFLFTLAFLV